TLSGHAALLRPAALFATSALDADDAADEHDEDAAVAQPLPALLAGTAVAAAASRSRLQPSENRARSTAHLFSDARGAELVLTVSCTDPASNSAVLTVVRSGSAEDPFVLGAAGRPLATLAPPPELTVVYARGAVVILARRDGDRELYVYQAAKDGDGIALRGVVSLGDLGDRYLDFLDFSPSTGRLLVLEQGVRSPTALLHCIDCGGVNDDSDPSAPQPPQVAPVPVLWSRPLPTLPATIGNSETLLELARAETPVLGPLRLKRLPHTAVVVIALWQSEFGYGRQYPSAVHCVRAAESSGDEGAPPVWSALVNFRVADMALDEAGGLLVLRGETPSNELCVLDVETGRDAAAAAAAPAPADAPEQLVSLDAADVMLAVPARTDDIAFTTR
ncbi:hypothetical protein HK405_001254, partial [Cladochytrium tenue]